MMLMLRAGRGGVVVARELFRRCLEALAILGCLEVVGLSQIYARERVRHYDRLACDWISGNDRGRFGRAARAIGRYLAVAAGFIAPMVPTVRVAAAGKTAMLFSRTNTLLSIPMLVAMTGAQTLG